MTSLAPTHAIMVPMAKSAKGKKRRGRAGPPPNAAAPKVHIKVAVADMDLRSAARLVKPALLYADRVTVYSPAASMMSAIADIGVVNDPRQQVHLIIEIIKHVPQLAGQLNVSGETLEQLKALLAMNPRLVRRIGAAHGARKQVDELYERLDGLDSIWQEQMPEALEKAKEAIGAGELLVAVQAGAVKVADLGNAPKSEFLVDAVNRAAGNDAGTVLDDLIGGFIARIVEMICERRSTPKRRGLCVPWRRRPGSSRRCSRCAGERRRAQQRHSWAICPTSLTFRWTKCSTSDARSASRLSGSGARSRA